MSMKLTSQSQLFKMAKLLEGMPVLHCLPNSPTGKLGIGYGDILLAVNGQKVSNIEEYSNAKKLRQGSMTMVIWRGGQELNFDIEFPSDNENE